MSRWDRKLLKYGEKFEKKMMDLSVNIPLEKALDLGWEIMADCFTPQETGIKTGMIEKFWPQGRNEGKDVEDLGQAAEEAGSAAVSDQPEVDSAKVGAEVVGEALSADSIPGTEEVGDPAATLVNKAEVVGIP